MSLSPGEVATQRDQPPRLRADEEGTAAQVAVVAAWCWMAVVAQSWTADVVLD